MAHGRHPGLHRRPAVTALRLARAGRARDQSATARRGARRCHLPGARPTCTTWTADPICVTRACPTRCGTATPPRRPSPDRIERAARSLVPVPAAGWRNVGRPLHADALTDAVGTWRCGCHTRGSRPPSWSTAGGKRWARRTDERRDRRSRDGGTDLRRRYGYGSPRTGLVNGPEGSRASRFDVRTTRRAWRRGGGVPGARCPAP
jgi:hypothetical protein